MQVIYRIMSVLPPFRSEVFGNSSPSLRAHEKKCTFCVDTQCQAAFDQLKSSLISADVLALPSDEGEYIIDTDASDVAMGAFFL